MSRTLLFTCTNLNIVQLQYLQPRSLSDSCILLCLIFKNRKRPTQKQHSEIGFRVLCNNSTSYTMIYFHIGTSVVAGVANRPPDSNGAFTIFTFFFPRVPINDDAAHIFPGTLRNSQVLYIKIKIFSYICMGIYLSFIRR